MEGSTIEMKGLLKKKATGIGRDHERFFHLVGSSLSYFEAERGEQLGTMDVTQGTVTEEGDLGFVLKGPRVSESYRLVARDRQERDTWVSVLTRATSSATPCISPDATTSSFDGQSSGLTGPEATFTRARGTTFHANDDVQGPPPGRTRGATFHATDDAQGPPAPVQPAPVEPAGGGEVAAAGVLGDAQASEMAAMADRLVAAEAGAARWQRQLEDALEKVKEGVKQTEAESVRRVEAEAQVSALQRQVESFSSGDEGKETRQLWKELANAQKAAEGLRKELSVTHRQREEAIGERDEVKVQLRERSEQVEELKVAAASASAAPAAAAAGGDALSALTAQLAAAEAKLAAQRRRMKESEARQEEELRRLEDELDEEREKNRQAEDAKQEGSALQSRVTELEEELERTKGGGERVEELEAELSREKRGRADSRAARGEQEKGLQDKIASLEEELNRERRGRRDSRVESDRKADELRQRAHDLEKALEEAEEEKSQLELSTTVAQKEMESLRDSVQSSGDIEKAKDDAHRLAAGKLAAVRRETDQLQAELADAKKLASEAEASQKRAEGLEHQLNTVTRARAASRIAAQSKLAELAAVRDRHDQASADNAKLRNELTAKEEALAEAEAAAELLRVELDAEKAGLQEDLAAEQQRRDAEKAALQEEVATERKRAEEAKRNLDAALAEAAQLKEASGTDRNALEGAEAKVAEMQSRLREQEERGEALRQQLEEAQVAAAGRDLCESEAEHAEAKVKALQAEVEEARRALQDVKVETEKTGRARAESRAFASARAAELAAQLEAVRSGVTAAEDALRECKQREEGANAEAASLRERTESLASELREAQQESVALKVRSKETAEKLKAAEAEAERVREQAAASQGAEAEGAKAREADAAAALEETRAACDAAREEAESARRRAESAEGRVGEALEREQGLEREINELRRNADSLHAAVEKGEELEERLVQVQRARADSRAASQAKVAELEERVEEAKRFVASGLEAQLAEVLGRESALQERLKHTEEGAEQAASERRSELHALKGTAAELRRAAEAARMEAEENRAEASAFRRRDADAQARIEELEGELEAHRTKISELNASVSSVPGDEETRKYPVAVQLAARLQASEQRADRLQRCVDDLEAESEAAREARRELFEATERERRHRARIVDLETEIVAVQEQLAAAAAAARAPRTAAGPGGVTNIIFDAEAFEARLLQLHVTLTQALHDVQEAGVRNAQYTLTAQRQAQEPPGIECDGVSVTGVDPDGPAARAGVREGMRLVSINGKGVKSNRDVQKGLKELNASLAATFTLVLTEPTDDLVVRLQGSEAVLGPTADELRARADRLQFRIKSITDKSIDGELQNRELKKQIAQLEKEEQARFEEVQVQAERLAEAEAQLQKMQQQKQRQPSAPVSSGGSFGDKAGADTDRTESSPKRKAPRSGLAGWFSKSQSPPSQPSPQPTSQPGFVDSPTRARAETLL
eukprot:Hpha_TRINITY_DN15722_c0_g1::TRINITY_DN15722_c0_g1_i1::g.40853::m.40853